jgi:predicted kinase
MRKWMRDRLKRRKKEPEGGSEKAPAPLQPAFYDTDVPSAVPAAKAPDPAVEASEPAVEPRETHEEPSSEVTAPVQTPSASNARSSRRRRGRGGRGRRGGSQRGTPSAPRGQMGESPAVPEAVAAPAAAAPPGLIASTTIAARAPKGVVVLAIGLPGSGKSSWFKRNKITPLSSDLLRSLLFDDPTEQRFQDLVFSNLRSMLKARLIARRPTNYVDATNLTPHERHNWIKLAKDYGYEVQAVFFDVPVEVCLERNRKRERVVAEDVMRRMSDKLKPPAFEEGFSKITVVRVKQKE